MNRQRLIFFSLIISLIFSFGFFIKIKLAEANHKRITSTLNEKLMNAKLEIGRAETKFGNASKQIKKLEKNIKKDIEERKSLITRYGRLEAEYKRAIKQKTFAELNIKKEINLESCKELVLKEGQLYVAENNQLGELDMLGGSYSDERLSISCSIETKVNDSKDIPFDISYSLSLNLVGEILETITPTGAINNYINIYEVDNEGKVIGKLEINSFNMIVDDQRNPKFFWWSPQLDIGMALGLKENIKLEGGASLGFSPMSYGLPKEQPIWRFGRLSLDIGENISVGLTPVLYNLGKNLPLFDNLWSGAFVNIDINNNQKSLGIILGASL